MVGEGLAVKTNLIAYPGEIVTNDHGDFLGFVMRLVSGYRPLHELYSPKSRMRHFSDADYRFLVHAASNVARAVGKVHQTGCVIGDLNHSGILVAPDATVALIDADSFQFRLNGASYPCVVGVPDFTPPELHGKNLATVERTVSHDHFGLAVAIFHLLFMGKHPYAGIRLGSDTSMGEDIAQNRFAYSLARYAQTQTKPPPGALTLNLFPNVISSAFEAAFGLIPSQRPSASDWVHALKKLESSQSHCNKIKTHYFPSSPKGCVWCELTTKSGLDMFPDLYAVAPNIPTDAKGTEQAIREIHSFRFPKAEDLLPTVNVNGVSFALNDAKGNKRGRALLGILIICGAIAGFILSPPWLIVWIVLAISGYIFTSNRDVSAYPYQQAYKDADEQVQLELNAFVHRNGLAEVLKVHGELGAALITYKNHDNTLARELTALKASREARQKQAYLDRFSLRRASISNIGPAKTAKLISFGIETAADVNQAAVLRVPGFGTVMTGKLLDWRKKHEARFKYDRTPNSQDVADEQALHARFSREKAKIESTIRNGLGTLRNAQAKLNSLPALARNDKQLTQSLTERAQAELDLQDLGATVPSSTVTLTVTPSPKPKYQPSQATLAATNTPRSTPASSTTPNCPQCGSRMVRRTARRGRNNGNQFWGCSHYPTCRGVRNI